VADRARGVLGAEPATGPANLGFQLLVDHVPQGAGAHDFFSGIVLQPGGEARRAPLETPSGPTTCCVDRDSGFAICRPSSPTWSANRPIMIGCWPGGQLVADLEPDQAAELLYQMARQYQRRGRWDLAFDITDLLITHIPTMP